MRVSTRDGILVLVMGIVVALSFGLSYGAPESNQTTYLARGIQLARPGFLARDWWLNQTLQYHFVFSRVVEAGALLGQLPIFLASVNLISITLGLVVTYLILLRMLGLRDAYIAWTLTVAIFFLGLRTETVGENEFFSPGLQPSTIATAMFLLAIYYFMRGRFGRSGVSLAIAGAFHLNFAIIGIAAFGLAQLCMGRRGLIARLFRQTWLTIAVVLVQLPVIWSIRHGLSAQDAQLADFVFFRVAEPFHYYPRSYLPQFLPFVAWQSLSWLALQRMPRTVELSHLRMLHIAMVVVIAGALALMTVVFVPTVAQAYFNRLIPFSQWLAIVFVAVEAAMRLDVYRSRDPAQAIGWPELAVRVTAATIIALFATDFAAGRSQAAIMIAAMVGLVLVWCQGWRPAMLARVMPGSMPAWGSAGRWIASAIILAAVAAAINPRHFDMIGKGPLGAPLYQWARTTDERSVFLTPPELVVFRLAAERAIVVDDKAVPIGARGVLEWYRRLEDVSGMPGFTTVKEARRGYRSMDAERLQRLARTYSLDYAVIANDGAAANFDDEIAYRDANWIVLRLKP